MACAGRRQAVYTGASLVRGVATGHGGAAPPARSSVRHGVARGTHCLRRLAVPAFVRRDARKPYVHASSPANLQGKRKATAIGVSLWCGVRVPKLHVDARDSRDNPLTNERGEQCTKERERGSERFCATCDTREHETHRLTFAVTKREWLYPHTPFSLLFPCYLFHFRSRFHGTRRRVARVEHVSHVGNVVRVVTDSSTDYGSDAWLGILDRARGDVLPLPAANILRAIQLNFRLDSARGPPTHLPSSCRFTCDRT